MPDDELIEFVCAENEKSTQRFSEVKRLYIGTSANGRPPFRNFRTISLKIAGCSQAIE